MESPHSKPVIAPLTRLIGMLAMTLLVSVSASAQESKAPTDNDALPQVRVSTSEGAFELRLRPDIAPQTVDNFLQYVEDGFYDGTVFHRVIPGFMIQGGGFNESLSKKGTRAPIRNESKQTAKNLRGTIAMARTQNPDSATAQFFINLVDNPHLNTTQSRTGYAVFGSVTQGMGVVDAIARVNTTNAKGMSSVPSQPVVIESIRLIDNEQ